MPVVEDAESLLRKADKAIKDGNGEEALELLTDAIELDDANYMLYSTRAAVYLQQETFAKAVEDAEKAVKLNPNWPDGYGVLGTACFGNKDFIGARRAFEKALQYMPDNENFKKGLESAKKMTEMAATDERPVATPKEQQKAKEENKQEEEETDEAVQEAEKRVPELVLKFREPGAEEKLRNHPRTKNYFKDKGFIKKLQEIKEDPKKMKEYLFEPRIMQCVGILTDIPMPDTSAGRAKAREELTISSEEEDDDTDSDSEDEDDKKDELKNLPKPMSVTQRGKPIMPAAQARAQLCKTMGVTPAELDSLMGKVHKKLDTPESSDKPETANEAKEKVKQTQPKEQENPSEESKLTEPEKVKEEEPDYELPPLEMPDNEGERKALSLRIKEEATEAYKSKLFKKATKLYLRCMELDPNNIVFYLNLGAVYLQAEEWEKCINICADAIKIGKVVENIEDRLLAKAYARSGKAHAGKQNFPEALNNVKTALEMFRCKEYLDLKKLYEKKKSEADAVAYRDPLKAQSAKARGNDFYKKGEYAAAIKEYSDALKRDPENKKLTSRVYSNRAACYNIIGEMLLAVKDCDACIAADPQFVKGYLRKGAVLNKIGQYGEAVPVFKKVLQLDPHNFEGRKGLETAEQGTNKVADTVQTRAEKAMQDPKIQEIWEASRELLKEMQEEPDSYSVRKQVNIGIITLKRVQCLVGNWMIPKYGEILRFYDAKDCLAKAYELSPHINSSRDTT
eukprot:m.44614 g.44614  ORF g.44614 m.44614 type:complete len:738 (-) comp10126_c0_seq2:918-3131(-)